MEIQQHDGVVVEVGGSRQGFAKHQREGEVSWGEQGGAGDLGAAALPPALLYIGPQGGRRPWEIQSPKGAAAKGGGVPPKACGAPPPQGFNPRRRGWA